MGLRVYKLNKQKRDFVKISVRLRSHKVLPLSPGTRPQWAWKAKAFSTLKQGSQPGGRDPWDVRRDKTTEAWLRARPTYTERADETTTSQISAGKRHPWETKSRTENTVAAQGRWETCPRQHDEPSWTLPDTQDIFVGEHKWKRLPQSLLRELRGTEVGMVGRTTHGRRARDILLALVFVTITVSFLFLCSLGTLWSNQYVPWLLYKIAMP